jgi:alcohol dehydrogenase class IV
MAGQVAQQFGAAAVFLITDSGVVAAGLLEPITAALESSQIAYTVYDQVVPDPDIAAVAAATTAFRQSEAQVLIGVGGGSALDTAKAVKIAAGGPPEATIWEYATLYGEGKRPLPSRRDMPAYIAVPTTAGTGAEVTPWAVITHPEKGIKFGVGIGPTTPDAALVDPDLTLSLPPHLTAATGMDALSHLIEAYVSTNYNPLLDPMILYGLQLVGRSLRKAVSNGFDQAARQDMLEASLIGGIAISSKWLGACHSLAHPLSSLAHVHHGLACAIMLPHQIRYSLTGAVERYAAVAAALDPGMTTTGTIHDRAEQAVTAVRRLLLDLNCPTHLRDAGVPFDLIPALSQAAYTDLNWWTNPQPVTEAALAQLYKEAY